MTARGRGGLIAAIEQRLSDRLFDDSFYLLADPSYAVVAGNLSQWPLALKGSGEGWSKFNADASKPGAAPDRALLRARYETLPDGFHLLIAKDIGDARRFMNGIYGVLAFTVLFVFLLAAVASVSVTRRTVGRIESINATSRAIMESGLGRRIPLRGTHDEWDQLARNLNSMLERIEGLMGEVKQVTDNVAHDLRTPLMRMRGRLEKASIGRREAEGDQSLISAAIADLDDVLRMFSSLTRISQIEAANRTAAFRTVDLAEVAAEVVELFDAAAEDKGGHIRVVDGEPVLVSADRDLLFDAMANLVDNAIKHGRAAGEVTVAVGRNDGSPSWWPPRCCPGTATTWSGPGGAGSPTACCSSRRGGSTRPPWDTATCGCRGCSASRWATSGGASSSSASSAPSSSAGPADWC